MSFDAAAVERSEQLRLVTFTADAAFEIGCRLRAHIRSHFPSKPAIIDIRAMADDQQYFFAVCAEGSQPDNKYWAERKRRSVVRRVPFLTSDLVSEMADERTYRWGKSTASLRLKWPQGIPSYFAASEDDYAIHGGGFPVRVQGIEPLVGTIVVSGLKQEEDHQVIVDVLTEIIEEQMMEREASK
ncbi:DUF967 domain protein [Rhodotorula toruloides ATCC 204091]|uniref:DUF967 domain protein n=1 Tax=Rhodotorula toruloides TaxID=5286 RepID=A0A0K3CHE8_RHOTO|nr:DUF967 domain protein [Rhodotorula toruloides ATCC 204091]PRQ74768.1 DUF967 domain protein [Rhodotorula toruloides]